MADERDKLFFLDRIGGGPTPDLQFAEITLLGTRGKRFEFVANSNGVHHLARAMFLMFAKMNTPPGVKPDPATPSIVLEVTENGAIMDENVGDARLVLMSTLGVQIHIPIGPAFAQQLADNAKAVVDFYREQADNPPTKN